jgi:hypothetical protein
MTYGKRSVWIVQTKNSEYTDQLFAISQEYYAFACLRQDDLEMAVWMFPNFYNARNFAQVAIDLELFAQIAM